MVSPLGGPWQIITLQPAEEFYMGGTKNFINQETRDALIAQGYGAYITPA